MADKKQLIQRIDDLLAIVEGEDFRHAVGRLRSGALTVATILYGQKSPQVEYVQSTFETQSSHAIQTLHGLLESFRSDVAAGLVGDIRREARGERHEWMAVRVGESRGQLDRVDREWL